MNAEQDRMRAAFVKWEAATNEYLAYLRAASSDDAPAATALRPLIDRMAALKMDFEDASKPLMRLVK